MSKKEDRGDDLAADAALAEDLGDEKERQKNQLAYLGGEIDDDVDNFDPSEMDDGSSLEPKDEPAPKEEQAEEEEEEDKDDDDEAEAAEEETAEEAEADAEDEDAAEEEASEGDDDEDSDGETRRAQGIPKHRFDEVNERRKAAEQRVKELEAQQQAAEQGEEEQFDFDAAELEYQELLLDGKTDEALAKRKEIRAAEKAAWQSETKQETQQDITQQQLNAELGQMTVEAEAMFDEFNPESEGYRQDLVDKTMVYYHGYLSSGDRTPADAFVDAVADVVELFGLKAIGEEDEPAPESKDKGKDERKPTGKKKVDPSKKEAREKAHEPVGTGGEGSKDRGAAVPNIEDMTEEEFNALPEATLARLRGDTL